MTPPSIDPRGKPVSTSPRRAPQAWIPCLLVALALVAGIGLRHPSPPDEPRFVLAAQAMVESGQWLVPHRGIEIYAEKPPLFMWLQAAAYTVAGSWPVAFLLPSLLGGMLTLVLAWDLARRLWNRQVAWHAAGALWVCIQFGLQAKRGQIDMVLVAMTAVSLWALLRHLLVAPSRPLLWLGAFAAGLGTITKGVGFLPLLVFIPWLALRRGSPAAPRAWIEVAVAFLAGIAVWLGPLFATILASHDAALAAYAHDLLSRQTGTRYANPWHHVQPWWYYGQVIATLWLPGSLLLPWLVPAWARRIRRRDPRFVLLLGWSLLVLVFFSLSPGKREVYLFPALPALCVAAAPLLPGLLRRRGVRWTLLGYIAVASLAVACAAVAGMSGWSDWAGELAARRDIAPAAVGRILAWLLALGIAGLLLAATTVARRLRVGIALVLFTCALWTSYGIGFAPAIDASSSARQVMLDARRRIGAGSELGLVAWREQHLLQAVPPVAEFGYGKPWTEQWAQAAAWAREAPASRWLFVRKEALDACVDRDQAFPIGKSNRLEWWLVPGTALYGGCTTDRRRNPPAETVVDPG